MVKSKKGSSAINLGASIELRAKTEIPSSSAGKFVDGLTDLISPFTQGAGYIGDRIALARQPGLKEIMKATKKRLEIMNKPVHPPANKFLIPLLQQASLEEPTEAKLIDMWANLIATSATEEVEMLAQYTSVMSSITASQAIILDKLFATSSVLRSSDFINMSHHFGNIAVRSLIETYQEHDTADEIATALVRDFDLAGMALEGLTVSQHQHGRKKPKIFITKSASDFDGICSDESFFDFQNLERLGLLSHCEARDIEISIFKVDLSYYIVSPIGIDFYACCNPDKLKRSIGAKTRSFKYRQDYMVVIPRTSRIIVRGP